MGKLGQHIQELENLVVGEGVFELLPPRANLAVVTGVSDFAPVFPALEQEIDASAGEFAASHLGVLCERTEDEHGGEGAAGLFLPWSTGLGAVLAPEASIQSLSTVKPVVRFRESRLAEETQLREGPNDDGGVAVTRPVGWVPPECSCVELGGEHVFAGPGNPGIGDAEAEVRQYGKQPERRVLPRPPGMDILGGSPVTISIQLLKDWFNQWMLGDCLLRLGDRPVGFRSAENVG